MNSVIKGASYILVHTPDMVLYNGTTQTTERIVNPESEYLKEVPEKLRSYEEAVSYWPNQTYIGNVHPEELAEVEFPWYDKKMEGADRYGKFGEIMPEEEFLLLVQACDMFEVVRLEKGFVAAHKEALAKDPVITEEILERVHEGVELSEIEQFVNEEHAEGLYFDGKLVGCVKAAHDIDQNLSAHVMHENLMSKASSVLALLYAVRNAGIKKEDVEYVIDCAEEACGDMNQRGGGSGEIRRIQDCCRDQRRLHGQAWYERQGPCEEGPPHPGGLPGRICRCHHRERRRKPGDRPGYAGTPHSGNRLCSPGCQRQSCS